MNLIRSHLKETAVIVCLLAFFYAYRTYVVGEMDDEIRRLMMPEGLPARRELFAAVRKMQQDARVVATRLDMIRATPAITQSLAALLERFHKDRNLQRERSRLVPREQTMLEGGIQQEMVDVVVTGLSLTEIIQYLSGLETLGTSIRIRSLRIQKAGDTATLTLTIASLKAPPRE